MIFNNINQLETPCIIVDDVIVERNISRFQQYCNEHNLTLRPHIKTHKIPEFAVRQLKAGAVGINCQKISEAEIFADAGIKDILITFNILGTEKLSRLVALAQRVSLTVVADSEEVVSQLSSVFTQANSEIRVLVECDTGAGRCGVQSPVDAQKLAQYIDSSTATRFVGLLTYPHPNKSETANEWLGNAKKLCEDVGLTPEVISTGGTPGLYNASVFTEATEYRVGTYIYNDRSLVHNNTCTFDDCALKILTTVVSTPTQDRVIVDAGSKSLSSDLLGLNGYGYVEEYPKANIYALSEEHGCIDFSECEARPKIGDQLHIIPNHSCVVSNLFDYIHLQSSDGTFKKVAVSARGRVW